MSEERYNGWANRETWAVALHINNDQGWQESVHEALREGDYGYNESLTLSEAREAYYNSPHTVANRAGEIIRENVEEALSPLDFFREGGAIDAAFSEAQWSAIQDIGSLWRVDWAELGASFLSDLDES